MLQEGRYYTYRARGNGAGNRVTDGLLKQLRKSGSGSGSKSRGRNNGGHWLKTYPRLKRKTGGGNFFQGRRRSSKRKSAKPLLETS